MNAAEMIDSKKMNVVDLKEFRARQIVEDGKYLVSTGDLDGAAETFQKSIEVRETAEAFTHLAWLLSLKGLYDEAIELCKKAICLDSSQGSPFNDIGSYLIQKNRLEDAIPWLEMAKDKRQYEPKHFPHINLGRVYSALGRIDEAIDEFEEALKIVPDHPEVLQVLEHLENMREQEINSAR